MLEDIAGLPAFRRQDPPDWMTDAQVRRGLRSGELLLVRPGVLIGRRRLELGGTNRVHPLAIEIALAGLRGGSQAYACLGSAAAVHKISRLGRSPERVRLYRERGGPWRDRDVAVLVCGLPRSHLERVDGIPCTTRSRTAVDLARWVTFRSAVVVMDSALRLGSSPSELSAVITHCTRWPGIRKARRAAAFADGQAQTPIESISRVAFAELGLPRPALQVPLPSVHDLVGIVDFYWEEYGVIGEADGLLKYDDPAALRAEKLRQEALEALGYIVVRWTWEDIWRRPEWVVARIRAAFRKAAGRRIA